VKVLLTGAFGYLGGRIALALPHEVVLGARTVPLWTRSMFPTSEVRTLDVLDEEQAAAAVAGMDAVVHLASLDENEASRDPDLAVQVSGAGTRKLLAAARRAGVKRFIYFSTFHVYGPAATAPITESSPVKPVHPYALSRLVGEGYCYQSNREQAAMRSLVVRMSNGFGAPVDASVDRWSLAHNDFCRQAAADGRIVLKTSGLQHRDLVWVEDVAQAVSLLLDTPAPEHDLFHVGGGASISMFDLAVRVQHVAERVLGRSVEIERPAPLAHETSVPVLFSVERLRSLGYVPRDGLDAETERVLTLLGGREVKP
jgi:UDP-glucose 4-epimerase